MIEVFGDRIAAAHAERREPDERAEEGHAQEHGKGEEEAHRSAHQPAVNVRADFGIAAQVIAQPLQAEAAGDEEADEAGGGEEFGHHAARSWLCCAIRSLAAAFTAAQRSYLAMFPWPQRVQLERFTPARASTSSTETPASFSVCFSSASSSWKAMVARLCAFPHGMQVP